MVLYCIIYILRELFGWRKLQKDDELMTGYDYRTAMSS